MQKNLRQKKSQDLIIEMGSFEPPRSRKLHTTQTGVKEPIPSTSAADTMDFEKIEVLNDDETPNTVNLSQKRQSDISKYEIHSPLFTRLRKFFMRFNFIQKRYYGIPNLAMSVIIFFVIGFVYSSNTVNFTSVLFVVYIIIFIIRYLFDRIEFKGVVRLCIVILGVLTLTLVLILKLVYYEIYNNYLSSIYNSLILFHMSILFIFYMPYGDSKKQRWFKSIIGIIQTGLFVAIYIVFRIDLLTRLIIAAQIINSLVNLIGYLVFGFSPYWIDAMYFSGILNIHGIFLSLNKELVYNFA
ncbi:hypothetical protein TUBRATIS_19730 [Tubulinosema ratisbonensis]|uniref:Uncharacterized protein n=1 Tax=Tubulinosema ratisbonensis TaxID=291195 RepID=A0A437AKF2_9MICR|nr:hypothetical protein TUBRATIS_19730 [Tubulinosema ratisbonensis]